MADDPRQLSFWDEEMDRMWAALSPLIMVILQDGVTEGIEGLPPNYQVLADFNLVNDEAINFATQYRFDLIKGITETTRRQVSQAITNWIREGSPLDSLMARLEPVFGAVRAEMIAVTETTRVYSQGNQMAWESTGVVGGMVWETVADDLVCEICGPMNDTEIGIGDIDAMPPAHPRCRCRTKPVVSMELVEKRYAEIFR